MSVWMWMQLNYIRLQRGGRENDNIPVSIQAKYPFVKISSLYSVVDFSSCFSWCSSMVVLLLQASPLAFNHLSNKFGMRMGVSALVRCRLPSTVFKELEGMEWSVIGATRWCGATWISRQGGTEAALAQRRNLTEVWRERTSIPLWPANTPHPNLTTAGNPLIRLEKWCLKKMLQTKNELHIFTSMIHLCWIVSLTKQN